MLEAIEVADTELSEAVELFQRCAKNKEKGQDVEVEVGQMVKELGFLALAVTLAGSNVSMTPRLSSNIRRYLPGYSQLRKELLCRRPKQRIHQYGESVLSTREACFGANGNQSPVVVQTLCLLASINFNDIFLLLFDSSASSASQQSRHRILICSDSAVVHLSRS